MIVGITQDMTTPIALDNELTNAPSNGIYINSGVHPMVTVRNLLAFLPKHEFTFQTYDENQEYKPFQATRQIISVVLFDGLIYQCIKDSLGNDPTDTEFWIQTNIESLRLKTFLYSVLDRVKSDLSLQHRLIDNQYMYEMGVFRHVPEGDYFGWAIEPKNSDYVSITINKMSIQNLQEGDVNVYVVNQNQLIDTLVISGGNGVVEFERTDYTFQGKGTFYFLVEKQEIKRNNGFVDWSRYDGFTCFPVLAFGSDWGSLQVNQTGSANGIGLNISAVLSSENYIENNLKNLAYYVRSVFEYMSFQMFSQNPNGRLSPEVRDQINEKIVMGELKNMDTDTVVSRYHKSREMALLAIQKTFDKHLHNDNGQLTVTTTSV